VRVRVAIEVDEEVVEALASRLGKSVDRVRHNIGACVREYVVQSAAVYIDQRNMIHVDSKNYLRSFVAEGIALETPDVWLQPKEEGRE
jgi:hypothetical protein